MSELTKVFLTAAITIIGSIIIVVIGQIIIKFVIEPIHEQKKHIAEINNVLIFYANQFGLYSGKNDQGDKVVDDVRNLSTKLRATTHLIPMYRLLSCLKIVKRKESIDKACSALIGLSNSVYKNGNHEFPHINANRKIISDALNIYLE